jgi:hypothetical protein
LEVIINEKNPFQIQMNQPAPTTAAAAPAPSASDEPTMSARLEEVMKSLAETARNTSDLMELLRALLKIVPLDQR